MWLIQHYDGRSSQLHTRHLQLLHFHEHRICQTHTDDNLEQAIVVLCLCIYARLGFYTIYECITHDKTSSQLVQVLWCQRNALVLQVMGSNPIYI